VRIGASARFREERERFRLVFTCEDCTHFALIREACGHGYPNADHRRARYEGDSGAELVFCKEWEIA
jgi:hypothetical protein